MTIGLFFSLWTCPISDRRIELRPDGGMEAVVPEFYEYWISCDGGLLVEAGRGAYQFCPSP